MPCRGWTIIFIRSFYNQNSMKTFFSCFSCGQKPSQVLTPSPIPITPSKLPLESQSSNRKDLTQEFDDDKSKSATTITFRTNDTAPSIMVDQQSYIRSKIDQMRKLALPQRKAMESQFIKQNLSRVKTETVYLIEKQWSELYTNYLKTIMQKDLRSINNSRLFDMKGVLRTDIREKQDYFIINDRVWKFIQQMYGGGPLIMQDVNFPVVQVTGKKHQLPLVGMVNSGYLCYMIAVFQCLFSNQQFTYYFYRRAFQQGKKKMPFHNAIHKITKIMTQIRPQKMQIKQLSSMIQSRFNPDEQHDAHQFFLYLINSLQEQSQQQGLSSAKINPKQNKTPQSAYSSYFRNNKSIFDRLFVGLMETTLTCNRCEEVSTSFQTTLGIELQIVDINLQKCISKHFSLEKLEDYECQNCKKKTKAAKQYFLAKTPNFLVLVLKKFTQNGKKIADRVKYPFQLDLKKICKGHSGDTRYTLQSVLVHKGAKSTKGHYYCYTHRSKHTSQDQKQLWQYANDEVCKQLEMGQVLGRDAYMLFYERK